MKDDYYCNKGVICGMQECTFAYYDFNKRTDNFNCYLFFGFMKKIVITNYIRLASYEMW